MGGDLKAAPSGKAPAFFARAQVIKGWLDASGKTQEKVYPSW